MLEVEVKFAVDDLPALARKLEERGALFLGRHSEADQYFRPPDRDFAKTDEALRLRQIGETTRITYKGPRRDASTKTRTEIEVPLGDGKAARASIGQLLEALGFQLVGWVRKERQEFRIGWDDFELTVCLDEVEEVGRFAEVEILAPEDQMEVAREAILRLAAELGLTRSERRSYLELLLEAKRQ